MPVHSPKITYVVIEVGGTHIRVAGCSDGAPGSIVSRLQDATRADYATSLDLIVGMVQRMCFDRPVRGVGLCLPAVMDPATGVAGIRGWLADWNGRPIRADLQARLGALVYVRNDMYAAGVGEAMFGHPDVAAPFWVVGIGTGTGGCLVASKGKNPLVLPSELGHSRLRPHGRRCACGNDGCLGAYVGGRALETYYNRPTARLTESMWRRWENDLAEGLHGICNNVPVAHILLHGGVCRNQAHRIPDIRERLGQRLTKMETPEIKPTRNPDAAMRGMLAIAAGRAN